jgi:hypothetical protein
MNKVIDLAGHAASYAGVLICLLTGAARLAGQYALGGYSIQSMFVFGMGLMIFACLAKLHILSKRQS